MRGAAPRLDRATTMGFSREELDRGGRAVGASPFVVEACCAERIRDSRRSEADEKACLKRDGELLGDAARAALIGGGQPPPEAQHVRVEARIGTLGKLALRNEGTQALGLALDHAQDIQRRDIARAFPDARQRRVAVELRHTRVLDESVAAQALERLRGMRGGALANVVLADRGREPAKRPLVAVEGRCYAEGCGGRRLGFER
jgi:hypothetical protein